MFWIFSRVSVRSVRKINRHSRGLRRRKIVPRLPMPKVRNTELVLNAYLILAFLAFLCRTGRFEPPMTLDFLTAFNTPSRARGQGSP